MKKLLLIFSTVAALFALASCGEKEEPKEETLDFSGIVVPKSIDVERGSTYIFTFVGGKGPAAGDKLRAKSAAKSVDFNISKLGEKSFEVTFPADFESGTYTFCIVRGDKEYKFGGNCAINIIMPLPSDGSNVFGAVTCEGKPVAGVVVSDGIEVTATDQNGEYRIKSEKKHGYVFISIPSGYRVASDATCDILPQFSQKLFSDKSTAERKDFTLIRDGDQTNHTMMFFGDIHLANRTNDRTQFASFTADVNAYVKAHPGEKIYAMTLGDMTWDAYWYSNNYTFTQYLVDVNKIDGLQIFHTIGNHDHDMNATGDWDTSIRYKNDIAPTCYSFNIGNIHYIALDNIECTNKTASTTNADYRTYNEKVVSTDIEWLKKDLSYVDKNTPLVITGHSNIFNQTGAGALKNYAELVSCLSAFSDVTFVTGHTHKMWTVRNGTNITEHNSGAVCAAWWWAGRYNTTLNIAQDGAPGGYRIMSVKGKEKTSYYKGTGKSENFQFRTYDRNCIALSGSQFISNASYAAQFDANSDVKNSGYATADRTNIVLINVWDYNDKWKIEVTEDGVSRTVTRMTAYDPLYLIAYTAQRYNASASPTFTAFKTNHIFSVKASSATSTLDIKVTDDEGRVYTEKMARPKTFSLDTYR